MKIVNVYPPNFSRLAKYFPIKGKPNILYAWGDTIYNPSGFLVPPELHAHEEVHGFQQVGGGTTIEDWWQRYCDDAGFRLGQELEAHRAEWNYIDKHWSTSARNARDSRLQDMAERLSGPLYGHMISKENAIHQILRKL